jgi:hypothetical protein
MSIRAVTCALFDRVPWSYTRAGISRLSAGDSTDSDFLAEVKEGWIALARG